VAATAFAAMAVVAAGGVALWRRAEAARADAERAAREARRAQREALVSETRSRASELRTRALTPDQEAENLADALAFRAEARARLPGASPEVDGALLQAAAAAILRPALEGAPGHDEGYAFSPDGSRVAVADATSDRVFLWDAADGRLLAAPRGGDRGYVRADSVRFTRDGSRLLAAFGNATWVAWGARDGSPELALGEGVTVAPGLGAYDVNDTGGASSDGAFARFNRTLYRTSDGRVAATLPEGAEGLLDVREVAGATPGLLTLWRDGAVRRWDLARGGFDGGSLALVRRGGLAAGAFSPDGARVVGRAGDGAARLWDVASARVVATLEGAGNALFRFSPGGRYVLGDRVVPLDNSPGEGREETRVWDDAGRVVDDVRGALQDVSDDDAYALWFVSDRSEARVGTVPGSVGVTFRSALVRPGRVVAGAFAARGVTLLVRPPGRSLHLWGEGDGAAVLTLGGRRGPVDAVRFARDGRAVVTGGALTRWDASDGSPRRAMRSDAPAVHFALSPDGARVAALHDGHAARLWDAGTGAPLASLGCWSYGVDVGDDAPAAVPRLVAAFSADGARLLTTACREGGADPAGTPELRLTDVATGDALRRFAAADHGGVAAGWLSPDGRRVVAGLRDVSGRLWDADAGRVLAEVPAAEGELLDAVFSADGARLVTAHAGGAVIVRDARTGARRGAVRLGAGRFVRATLSADGARAFTSTGDRVDALWDAASGRRLAPLSRAAGPAAHAAFSPDGARLATAYEDGSFALWHAAEGQLLAEVPAHIGAVRSVAFSADGSRLATASDDGTARLWALDADVIARAGCGLLRGRALWAERPRLRAACGERP